MVTKVPSSDTALLAATCIPVQSPPLMAIAIIGLGAGESVGEANMETDISGIILNRRLSKPSSQAAE